jgi:adenosylcobinamide-phosphate synthase
LIIVVAYLLDLLFGDPRWFPHPVKGIGRLIQKTELLLRKSAKRLVAEKAAGVLLVILVVLPVYALSSLMLSTAFSLSWFCGIAFSVLMAYTTLAVRGLADAARAVLSRLDADDLAGARKELSLIVGRDTADLNEQEISRAVIETVAENASDGVVAPLFYLVLGGPGLAMAYKAVNTLDSMVGYKNEKYINFGWAAAKLDDIVNYVPARITAVLICLASGILRGSKPTGIPSSQPVPRGGERDSALSTSHFAFSRPWRIMLRDGGNHPSPNSGWPEAAMAGALGVRLGGPSSYFGKMSRKPFIGEYLQVPRKKNIAMSVGLLYCSSLLAVLLAALGAAVQRTW